MMMMSLIFMMMTMRKMIKVIVNYYENDNDNNKSIWFHPWAFHQISYGAEDLGNSIIEIFRVGAFNHIGFFFEFQKAIGSKSPFFLFVQY